MAGQTLARPRQIGETRGIRELGAYDGDDLKSIVTRIALVYVPRGGR